MRPFDQAGAFVEVKHEGKFNRLVARGVGATVLSGGLGIAVQMMGTVVLGRLLTPSDFGIVTMVSTFSMLLMNIGLNGFTEGVVQRDRFDHQLASNLFWINFAAGVILTAVFASSSRLIAWFYGEPATAQVAVVMSLTIFFNCASVLHLALLKRAMKFTATSIIEVLARVASVTVAILFAWGGWGYWALVASALVAPMATCIGAFGLCTWAPGPPKRADGTASMVKFAASVYGRYTVNYCSMTLDQLLLGWRFDAQSLGFYKKAYDLFFLTYGVSVARITLVAVAALSRLKHDPEEYRRYLANVISIVALLGMGIGGGLTLVGGDIIRLVLGPGWEKSGQILTWFGLGTGIMLIHTTNAWIHLSLGRADRWFRWGVLEMCVIALLFVSALRWGPNGVAAAWTISFWLLIVPAFWYAGRPIQLGSAFILKACYRYVLAAAIAGGATFMLASQTHLIPETSTFIAALERVLMTSAVFGILYCAMIIVLHRGLTPLNRLRRFVMEMLPGSRSSSVQPSS